jgi:ribosomal protein S18 acetylase RimI-like enzyme
LPKRIGRGIGRALFDHAVRRAASLGAGSVRIEADPYAEGFYRRMGARWVGEISYPIDGQERKLPLLVAEVRNHRTAWSRRGALNPSLRAPRTAKRRPLLP